MVRYRLTPKAREGLRGILDYVAQRFGVRVAERVLAQIAAAFESIAGNPGIGHRRADLTPDDRVRFWSVGATLIAYRDAGDGSPEILAVERGERDWGRVLDEGVPGQES